MTDEALARRFLEALERPCSSPGGFTRHATFTEVATFIDGMVYAVYNLHRDLRDPLKWRAFRWWLALRCRSPHFQAQNLIWSSYVSHLFHGDAEAIQAVPRLYADFLTRRFPTGVEGESAPETVPLLLLGWVDRWNQAAEVRPLLSEFSNCKPARIKRAVDNALDGSLGAPVILQVNPSKALELLDQLDELSLSACISSLDDL